MVFIFPWQFLWNVAPGNILQSRLGAPVVSRGISTKVASVEAVLSSMNI